MNQVTMTLERWVRDVLCDAAMQDCREYGRFVGECSVSSMRYHEAARWFHRLVAMDSDEPETIKDSAGYWQAVIRWLDIEIDDCRQAACMNLSRIDREEDERTADALARVRVMLDRACNPRVTT